MQVLLLECVGEKEEKELETWFGELLNWSRLYLYLYKSYLNLMLFYFLKLISFFVWSQASQYASSMVVQSLLRMNLATPGFKFLKKRWQTRL